MISPPYHIKNAVKIRKDKLKTMIPMTNYGMTSVPHITLFKHYETEERDSSVIERAIGALQAQKAFDLKIQNVDFFKNLAADHIILKVEMSVEIQQIYGSLYSEFEPPGFGKSFTPHITIGRGISHSDLQKVLPFLHEFNYVDSYTCDRITILRKVIEKVPTKYTRLHEVLLK